MTQDNLHQGRSFQEQSYNYCALPLAHYASRPDVTRGRVHAEPESRYRTCFQRDRDRIIHSEAFRRLKYKTQVFVYHQGDHYRTRLTHTLEVAQIARALSRALMVNEDLAEAISLAHDLGHPPFAHSGEEALQHCMDKVGGIDHNDQSLRVLTFLERKYPGFQGLNLSWETLEGIVKHNGPLVSGGKPLKGGILPLTVRTTDPENHWRLETHASVEAQIAALSDDIAYNSHDIEDGLRAGLFTLEDIGEVAMIRDIIDHARREYPAIEGDILRYEIIREMIGEMVQDVLAESQARLAAVKPQSPEDVRLAASAVVAFSPGMLEKVNELRRFLWERMYRHYTVRRSMHKYSRVVQELYGAFVETPELLPEGWQRRIRQEGADTAEGVARVVADYIASMTDRYAILEHERLFEPYRHP